MIHVISADNRHLYEDVLESHFRIRHKVFVEERGWETLRRPDNRELDDYDDSETIYLLALEGRRVIGGHRLYPTVLRSMVSDIFPHLARERGCPASPEIFEWSRYFVVPEKRDGSLNLQLMMAVQEFAHREGISQITAIFETWWLPRFHDCHFKVTPLGLPDLIENASTMAGIIDISERTIAALQEMTGCQSVLQQNGPASDPVARAHRRSLQVDAVSIDR